MRGAGSLVIAVALAALAGCGPPNAQWGGQSPPRPADIVDRIEILSLPVAINLDNVQGADGVRLQVYLFQYAQAEPVTAAGTLEFLLFDRKLGSGEAYAAEPFHAWSFQGETLAKYLARSMIGWNYSVELRWGDDKRPASATVTVLVRYTPPAGQPVYSSPVMISMGSR